MKKRSEDNKIAAAFHNSANSYDNHVLVQKRVVSNLALLTSQHLTKPPEQILDVGTGTGALLERFRAYYPESAMFGVDIAANMCRRAQEKLGTSCVIVNGSAEQLPFRSDAFDLVVSASVLQWVNSLAEAVSELCRVVKRGGNIKLAFFCAGTLCELQHCFGEVMSHRSQAACDQNSRLHSFWNIEEMRTIADAMDFEKVVLSVETEVDWYDDLHSLLRSIRNIGAGTVSGGAINGLGWRGILQEAAKLYKEKYGQAGKIPATYKVLYLSAYTKK